MRRAVIVAALGLGFVYSHGEAEAQEHRGVVIEGITIVSPERSDPLQDAYVVVEDEWITAVGTGTPPDLPADYTRIDGRGRYLTPGLIDSHVHLAGVSGFPFPTPPELAEVEAAYVQQLPRSYLYFGFTTLIDLNVIDRGFIEALQRAEPGPDIYDCDSALTLANGYPMVFLPPGERFSSQPNFLYDPRQADAIPAEYRPEDHTPRAVVQRVADAGGICVKTHFEDGFGSAKIWPTPTAEMIDEVIAESHRRDLVVTMHANAYEAQRFAADRDVDVIVHGLWNWDDLTGREGLPEPLRAVLDSIVSRDIGFMPTTQVLAGLDALFDPEFLDDPQLGKVLPGALIQWYRTGPGRWFAEELEGEGFVTVAGEIDQGARVVRYLDERGARLLMGSDTPSAPTYGNPPGYNGFLEMKTWEEIGVSPRRILAAATIENARAFNLDGSVGTIEPGKLANLLVLRGDPLAGVDAYDTIEQVIVRGTIVERESLAADQSH